VEQLAKEYDITIDRVDFPLHPDTPAEGTSLLELFGGGPQARARIEASQQRLKQLAAAEGLPMATRERTYNSRLCQELGVWAAEQGRGDAFRVAAYRAYFAEGKDISNPDVLTALAASVGLDAQAASTVITQRTYKDKVDAEWKRAYGSGVNAIPTFLAGGQTVVGAQPYEVLARLVEATGARKRSSP
jgi:predicted DsbA family dithiol-disulfide isomerase